MEASIFGLKEYADGEATLCDADLHFTDNDLSALEAWLRTSQDVSNEPPANFAYSTHRSVRSSSVESFDFDFGGNFDYINNAEAAIEPRNDASSGSQYYCSPTVVFEEDPLSCLLNTSNSFFSSPDIKVKKRGRKPKSPSAPRTPPVKRLRRSVVFTPVSPQDSNSKPATSQIVQYRQKRFPEDVYSPLLVRGRGAEREGCCPLCAEPQVWLKIKQSAYWYHMNFFHGICASTGRPYDPPAELRYEPLPGKPESVRIEGFCQDCAEWVVVVAENPKLATEFPKSAWYKHAQKCQSRILADIEYPESLL